MIEFRTLGTIDLRDPEGVAIRSVLSQPKRLALLAYLVLDRPGDPHRRDTLLGLFWPEREEERARAALRKSLHYLRRSLGEDALVGHGEESVGVRTDRIRCDALEFERGLDAGDPALALELYGGDLLDGLFVSEAPGFERWLDRRRWELRDLASRAAWELAEAELVAGNPVGAAHWGRRAYGIDPIGEAGLRRLLGLLDRVGDRAGAILAFEEAARRLEPEGIEPAPQTRALIEDIRSREEPPAERTPDRFGSEGELPDEGRDGGVEEAVPPAAATSSNEVRPAPLPDGPLPGRRRGTRRQADRSRLRLRIAALAALILAGSLAIRTLTGGSSGAAAGSGGPEGEVPVVLADFESPEPGLARAATEAFRIDISQSPVVRPAGPERVAEALVRMGRDPHDPLDARTARELARREGIAAVIEGAIHPAGRGFVLSASLLSTADDAVLAAHREVAEDSGAILRAIDALSGTLRRRIGESAGRLRSEPPLEQTTTSNLRALESFSLALRALLTEGDLSLGVSLLEEAVELDSTFAAAQATLGMVLANTSRQRTRAVEALTRAYRHRDRLPRRERLWHAAFYHEAVEGSLEEAARLYESLIELEADRAPRSDLHDLHAEYADIQLKLRADRRAEELARRAVALDDLGRAAGHSVLTQALAYQGRAAEAESTVVRYLERAPHHLRAWTLLGNLEASAFDHEAASVIFGRIGESAADDPFYRTVAADHLAALAAVRGRLARAVEIIQPSTGAGRADDAGAEELGRAAWAARLEAEVARRPDRARARLEAALERHRLTSIPLLDRPYLEVAEAFALAGGADRARELLAEFEALPPHAHVDVEWVGRLPGGNLRRARGALALAEGRLEEAVEAYRGADAGRCRICALPGLARAFDRAGRPDSARAIYERYLRTPEAHRLWADPFYLGPAHERLGELYEARGDSARAAEHFQRFVALWREADPVLEPRLEEARRRLRTPRSR